MSKHSIARKSDIRAGRTFYAVHNGHVEQWRIIKHEKSDWNHRQCFFEVQSKSVEKDRHWYNRRFTTSLGDMGVPGFAYDDRPSQVFTNRRSAEYWCKQWDRINPNFLCFLCSGREDDYWDGESNYRDWDDYNDYNDPYYD